MKCTILCLFVVCYVEASQSPKRPMAQLECSPERQILLDDIPQDETRCVGIKKRINYGSRGK